MCDMGLLTQHPNHSGPKLIVLIVQIAQQKLVYFTENAHVVVV